MRVVAIAKELQRREHDIAFIAAGKLIPVIKNFGINVWEASDMPDSSAFGKTQNVIDNKAEIMRKMQDIVKKISTIEMSAVEKIKPHLIIGGTLSVASVASKAKIPSIITILQPHGEKTLNMFKSRMQESGAANLIASAVQSMADDADIILLEGMPEISGGLSFRSLVGASTGFSFKDKIRFTGPLLIEYPDQLPERSELKEKHIGKKDTLMAYITIGGGSPLIGEQFLSTALEALKRIPAMTGVISTGMDISPEVIENLDPPANAIIRGFVPGTEMIKASDVTIFHGGSSTLMNCIACGTPAIVVPSIGEQEDNGAVLAQAGAGIVLEKQSLTPLMLAEAMTTILNNESYRTSALQLKALGEKYGGASAAADWAEELVVINR